MIDILIDVVKAAGEQGWLDELRAVFSRKHRVLVLGPTGVGKTNLCRALEDDMAEAIAASDRTHFSVTQRIKIEGSFLSVIDVPGEEQHRTRRIDTVGQTLNEGMASIINVVCYGYHEFESARHSALNADGTAREDFLAHRRAVELSDLGDWANLPGVPENVAWMMTAVTKADLWWDRFPEVMDHYQRGAYQSVLGNAGRLNPVVVPFSAVIHKFYDAGRISGAFDDRDRRTYRRSLMRTILEAIGKGGRHG